MRVTWLPCGRFGRARRDAGMTEVATAIFVLPFVVALLFVTVEVGMNLRYRAMVDNIVQDTVRGVAQDGALKTRFSTTLSRSGTQTWQQYGQQRLDELCGDGSRRCGGLKPSMTCPVPGGTSAGGSVSAATAPGTLVTCTATFPYQPVAGFTVSNRLMNLGFGRLWAEPISTSATARTVVGTSR